MVARFVVLVAPIDEAALMVTPATVNVTELLTVSKDTTTPAKVTDFREASMETCRVPGPLIVPALKVLEVVRSATVEPEPTVIVDMVEVTPMRLRVEDDVGESSPAPDIVPPVIEV